jgi:hypothetical protein
VKQPHHEVQFCVWSYDQLIRDDEQFRRIQRYIEHNPVRAGLAASPEQFAWSSAAPGQSPAAG